jgi:hypothetical protein
MPEELAQLLRHRIEEEYPLLSAIPDSVAAEKPTAKWSRKEETGHLIDSAANNHLRFVRAALEEQYRGPGYDQDGSVALHGYQDLRWTDLVSLWRSYNLLLAELIQRIPSAKLETLCLVAENPPVTLKFLIEDYVLHLRHHVDHILRREEITRYPAA